MGISELSKERIKRLICHMNYYYRQLVIQQRGLFFYWNVLNKLKILEKRILFFFIIGC
ncbi:hypothetical protein YPPY94_1584 [Yersinia pestis PY-94]|nr:hypothetical protein YPPY02_1542 [Yersinia pestis PY-02]EIT19068.1 hypothetical protein YPPY94_1584 [Yersinia pestis PY-94]